MKKRNLTESPRECDDDFMVTVSSSRTPPPSPDEYWKHNRLQYIHFGKWEVEEAARTLVYFFVALGEWRAFTLGELCGFCLKHGLDPGKALFGLICPWFDTGGLGGWRESPMPPYLVHNPDGSFEPTIAFIQKLDEANARK